MLQRPDQRGRPARRPAVGQGHHAHGPSALDRRAGAAGLREIEVASFVPPAAAADGRRRRGGAPCLRWPGPDGDGAGAQPARRRGGAGRRACTSSPCRCRPARPIRWPMCARHAARWWTRCAPSSRCATTSAPRCGRGRHLHRLRLHAAGRGARGRRDPPGRALAQAGVDERPVDTTGMANPAQVRRLFTGCARSWARTGAAHMHNTRGLGLANCLAAYDVGVRTFDSVAGRPGRLPLRARRVGQRGDRGPGLHVRGHGRAHRRDLTR
jgi:hypothetical protein